MDINAAKTQPDSDCPRDAGIVEQINNRFGDSNYELEELIHNLDRYIDSLEISLVGPTKDLPGDGDSEKTPPSPNHITYKLDRYQKLRCMLNNAVNRLSKLADN